MKDLLHNKNPMYLEDFLEIYGNFLKHTRALYVVEPNLDRGDLVKFGIAGMNTGNAYARLKDYIIIYGKKDKNNECKGVRIHYCGITDYNRLVEHTHTEIHKVELKLKQVFKSTADVLGRGTERTTASIEDVLKTIKEVSRKERDKQTEINKTTRETSQKYREDTRAFINTPSRRSERLMRA